MRQTIVFVCPHNAAKSVIAAAYFQDLADRQGLSSHAISAGTEPSPAVVPAVVEVLRRDGIDVAGYQPRRVTQEELGTAARVVSLGCDLHDFTLATVPVEHWNDMPPPSKDLDAACTAIRARVERLVMDLQTAGSAPEEEGKASLWPR
jgi:arsenate reductase